MVDLEILEEAGGTHERLRSFFEAKLPESPKALAKLEPDTRRRIERDIRLREKLEVKLSSILNEGIQFNLANAQLYSAVDLAWDSSPINKRIMPLMLYAQGRIDMKLCGDALSSLPDSDQFVRKDAQGSVVGIDLPKFTEVNINLVRSVITRRVAAQCNKYNNLWPFFKYEARNATSMVGKLRADMVSQRMDIMADQYDYRRNQEQVTRDVFLYGHSVEFPRVGWDRETQWVRDPQNPALATEKVPKRDRIVREGVPWVNPHPSRVSYDNSYPLASLNSDTGCEWVFFWDVVRWRDLKDPAYFNRDTIHFSTSAGWFGLNGTYWSQYYDRTVIKAPQLPPADEVSGTNDRKNAVGIYTGEMDDTSAFVSNVFLKMVPKDWGLADYPFPVWLRLVVGGDSTVLYAEWLASSPAAVYSFNEHDGRLINISMAHELMGLQDQLTNLFSQLLETAKADLFSVAVLNTDIFPDTEEGKKVREQFNKLLKGQNFYASMQVLETSFDKLKELGMAMTADNIFKVQRSAPNTSLSAILESISRVIQLAERLMVMSPQEQGQPAPREISATETNVISGTTESVYSFISDALDAGRAAKKRICYESLISCGSSAVYLPTAESYPEAVVRAAGFEVVPNEGDTTGADQYSAVTGSKYHLVHDYTFTSRDGGERALNSQSASVLTNLLGNIGSLAEPLQMAIFKGMGKQGLYDHINEIYRLSGASVTMKLQVPPGQSDDLLPEDQPDVMTSLAQLAQAVAKNTKDIQQLVQSLGTMLPQPQGNTMPEPRQLPAAISQPQPPL